jgi:hypothetical protein
MIGVTPGGTDEALMTLPIEGAAGLAGTLIDGRGGGHCQPQGLHS